jgi:hypothetical protein
MPVCESKLVVGRWQLAVGSLLLKPQAPRHVRKCAAAMTMMGKPPTNV